MENLSLKASVRTLTKADLIKVRAEGNIPAVVYGQDFKNQALVINEVDFKNVFKQAGENTLVDLSIDNQAPFKVIIQDLQLDAMTDKILHVDFRKVIMTEKIEAEIPLEFFGEAPAVKALGGMLVRVMDELSVKCLPQYLIKEIKVDISGLKTFEDMIKVKDLNIPENIEILDELTATVANVIPPRTEEELKALDEKVSEDVAKVEVAGKKEEASDEAAGEDSGAKGDKAPKAEKAKK